MTNPTPHGQVPEALETPSPDQLRAIARAARNSSGSASDDCGPLAYVLHGWRAAVTAIRATHVQNPAEIEHVAGDVSKNGAESDMAQQPAPSAAAHVGDSLFESWFSEYNPAHRGTKQQMRDAYAAGMGDPKAQPSPTPQADSQPAMTPETVYAAIAHGDEEHRAWLLSALRAVWCGEAVPPVASPIANAPADSVTAPAGGANWQDISTAPKDGTRFVAAGNNYGLDSETQHVCIAQWFRGCWMEVSDWNEASELKYLTHWMPLLQLPGNAARKQGANHD